jgi:hypothetical protein
MAAVAQTEEGIAMASIANSNGPAEVVPFHYAALFCLVVDDFFIQSHVWRIHHLSTRPRDSAGSLWSGKALQRFTHPSLKTRTFPHPWTQPDYGATTQNTIPEDASDPLDKHGIQRLQEIVGTFLFYGRAVDNTMLVALGTIAAAQTNGTETTMHEVVQLLNYAATHPEAAIRYHNSDMILYVHSDASYLSEPKARSRLGGYFYLGN